MDSLLSYAIALLRLMLTNTSGQECCHLRAMYTACLDVPFTILNLIVTDQANSLMVGLTKLGYLVLHGIPFFILKNSSAWNITNRPDIAAPAMTGLIPSGLHSLNTYISECFNSFSLFSSIKTDPAHVDERIVI